MIEKTNEARALIARLEARENRSRKGIAIWTVTPILFVAAFVGVAAYQLNKMTRELEAKKSQKASLEVQIKEAEGVLSSLNLLLREFGWTAERVPRDFTKVRSIKESLEADEELRRLASAPRRLSPTASVVQYYPKDLDGEKVRSALKSFGFIVEEKPPLVSDLPVNDVVFGAAVQPDDAKIVAYVLIRAGIEIRGIHLSRLSSKAKGIQVLANRIIASAPSLSVADIRKLSDFDPDPI